MSKRLTPSFIELTHEALLKAFWHKPSLRIFLEQHGIKDTALAQWHPDQTKRVYIDWLWPQLVKTEQGHRVILSMARSLADMQHFPDLERKEDTKYLIPEAEEAVSRLRERVRKVDESLQETRDAAKRRNAAIERISKQAADRQSLVTFEQQLNELTQRIGTQQSGYAFEKWFYDLAIFFELDARPGYVANGRQIDGAVTIEGTTFLIETKITRDQTGSPDIDTFMAKIESKADNTMGLFVSMSGFTNGAISAASKPRTPMLLIDHSHIYSLILRGVMPLPYLVSRIKRHASQTGSSYLGVLEF
jgi:hypothetical protein